MAAARAVGGAPPTIDWPAWQDDLPGNVLGQAHALTAFAPMPWWQAVSLKLKFTLLKLWPNLALPRHHFVYFGRWTILRRPSGTGKRGDCYVLIETNYNGSFAEYIDTIATDLRKYMERIWGPCYGCPPHIHPPSAFRQYARRHELPAQHYFCAYPEATVKEIEAALKLIEALPDLDQRSAGDEAHTQLAAARAQAQMAVRERQKMTWRRRLAAARSIIWPDRAPPVSAVTTLTPIRPGQLEPLKGYLADLDRDVRDNRIESPFKNVEGTHFARWVVVDQLQNEGKSEAPLDLHPPGLLFGSVGDGKPGAYLDRLCARISDRGRDVWVKHCEGLEGPGVDASTLKRYLNNSRLRGGLLYQGYEANVDKVRRALAVTRQARVQEPPSIVEDRLATSVTAVRANDLADIQGNILSAYHGLPFCAFLLVHVDRPARGSAWLGGLLNRGRVTTAQDQETARECDAPLGEAWNVGFTFMGMRALGVPGRLLTPLPKDFRGGMQRRAGRLGDVGANDPEKWETGLTEEGGGHVMLMIRSAGRGEREEARKYAHQLLRDCRLRVVYEETCDPLTGYTDGGQEPREHFGFADGFSQPAVEGTRAACRDRDQAVKAGELLLGYLDEEGEIPGSARFFRNGSFMVFRKLEQRVAAFREVLAANAGDLLEEELKAKIVGRWPDGAPLVLFEEKPKREPDRRSLNDFSYGVPADRHEGPDGDEGKNDPYGFRCPLGAHIRRTFPRDALVGGAERMRRHRVLRRGMPYGSRAPAGVLPETADDRGRGLLFICFNASIARQFETVQSWCLDGNLFDVPGEPDFLLGPASATMTVQTKPPGRPRVLSRTKELVVTKGGGYFFYPSIDALTAIATQNYLGQDDALPR